MGQGLAAAAAGEQMTWSTRQPSDRTTAPTASARARPASVKRRSRSWWPDRVVSASAWRSRSSTRRSLTLPRA